MLLILIKVSLPLSISSVCDDESVRRVRSARPHRRLRRPSAALAVYRGCGSRALGTCASAAQVTGDVTSSVPSAWFVPRGGSRLKDIFKWDFYVSCWASRAFTVGVKGRTNLSRERGVGLEGGAR